MEFDKLFTAYPKLIHEIFKDYQPVEELKHLNKTQITTLVIMHLNPECKMTNICNHLNLKKGSFTTVIESLVTMGYVNKARSNRDKRSFKLGLTDTGEDLTKIHIDNISKHLSCKFDRLNSGSFNKFVSALTDLYDLSQELKELEL